MPNKINFDSTPIINFTDPNTTESHNPVSNWKISEKPVFLKQCVKTAHFGINQTRIIFPKALIEAYALDSTFNAYFILYKTDNKLMLIITKDEITDADFKRSLCPIGVGLYYTVVPPKLLKYLNINKFPDYIWLQNTDKSTDEDVILEIHPAKEV